MANFLKDIYELFVWWVRFFNTRREDNKNIDEWLKSQIVYNNAGLQINYTVKSEFEDIEDSVIDDVEENKSTILKFNGKDFIIDEANSPNYTGSIVNWGDGVVDSPEKLKHTYEKSGEYTIVIKDVPYDKLYCFREAPMYEVIIYDDITLLNNGCFTLCETLESVIIFSNILKLGNNCFGGCYNLADINMPNSITEIGDNCFSGCNNLTNIILPNNLQKIGGSCFMSCTQLKEINIPLSVTSIGGTCFINCRSLEKINLNWTTNEDILSFNSNWLYQANQNAKFTIPKGTSSLYTHKGYPESKIVERD